MRAFVFILLCCVFASNCYTPKYLKKYEEMGIIKVVEVHKTEMGWDIIWEDYRQNEHVTFANDTSVYHVGYKMRTLIKL